MGSLYAKDVIEKAQSFIGYHEGPNNDNYFADVLDGCDYFAPQKKQYVPWCAVFCDACCLLAAIPEDRDDDSKKYDAQYFLYQPSYNNYSASANLFAGYFISAGAWFASPEPGDMIFFKDSGGAIVHVGIVESVEGRTINTIEGNASDMVRRKSYDIGSERIAGFGRPRYDGYEQEQETPPASSEDNGPAEDYQKIKDTISQIRTLLGTLEELIS